MEDRKFLQSIFSPFLDQSTVDLSNFDTEKIHGYAIVLKQIDGKGLPSFCFKILYNYRTFLRIPHGERSQGFRAVAEPDLKLKRVGGGSEGESFFLPKVRGGATPGPSLRYPTVGHRGHFSKKCEVVRYEFEDIVAPGMMDYTGYIFQTGCI